MPSTGVYLADAAARFADEREPIGFSSFEETPDPVLVAVGQRVGGRTFYSAASLLQWLETHNTDPLTREPLTVGMLEPLATRSKSILNGYAPTVRALNAAGRDYPLAAMLEDLQAFIHSIQNG